jgi:hypothetical protein
LVLGEFFAVKRPIVLQFEDKFPVADKPEVIPPGTPLIKQLFSVSTNLVPELTCVDGQLSRP